MGKRLLITLAVILAVIFVLFMIGSLEWDGHLRIGPE